MQKQIKEETIAFRCTKEFKNALYERAKKLDIDPSKYIISLLEKDINRGLEEPQEHEKVFIQKVVDSGTDKILSFITERIDSRLLKIERSLSRDQQISIIIEELVNRIGKAGIPIKEETILEWTNRLKNAANIPDEAKAISSMIDSKIAGIILKKQDK